MTRTIRWEAIDSFGAEHLTLQSTDSGFVAQSVVISSQSTNHCGASYKIDVDHHWRVKRVELRLTHWFDAVILHSDGNGRWQDSSGRPLPAFDGCVDVDISLTPFTNTLPINRLNLAKGEAQNIKVVYFPSPLLQPVTDMQRYTCIEEGSVYLYEALERGRRRELRVDSDGVVVDYAGLFRRSSE